MHEHSLMQDLFNKIDSLAKEADATQITKVHIQLGALAQISPEHFTEHFNEMRKDSVAEFAVLEITQSHDIYDPQAQDIKLLSIDITEP